MGWGDLAAAAARAPKGLGRTDEARDWNEDRRGREGWV